MYNLLVNSAGWNGHRDLLALGRVYAREPEGWMNGEIPDFDRLKELPTIFAWETNPHVPPRFANVGQISKVKLQGVQILVEYQFDPTILPIPHEQLIALAPALDITVERRRGFGDLEHSAWYLKDADLFRTLLSARSQPSRQPSVFRVDTPQCVDSNMLAVMMPFAGFDSVWGGIQRAAASCGMRAIRADDIWQHRSIIQDIVSLIDRGAIVVCDCTDKNANVFYEMGIADALGKEVITITQHKDHIPFDIGHLRYIQYHNNEQGVFLLEQELVSRIATLKGKR